MSQPVSIAVILNVSAGTARKHPNLDTEIGELFRAAGRDAEIIVLQPGENPIDAARDASARFPIVVAGGGDGTISSVVTGLFGSPAVLGVLPLGTFNHFAKDLGIPTDLPGAVAVVAAGHLARVDAAQVNDRVFVNNCSIGLYPNIVAERERLRSEGRAKWAAMTVATLRVLRRYRGVSVRIGVDGRQQTRQTPFVFVGNNEYAIEGFQLGGRARLDQGQLFVYLTPRTRTRHLPMLLARALAGRAGESGAFEIVAATELTIGSRAAKRMRVAVDGEVVPMSTPLRFRVHPGALPVLVPQA